MLTVSQRYRYTRKARIEGYVGEFGMLWHLKKCLSVISSRVYSNGVVPVSTHRLTAGEDLKAPVMALRHAFCIGSRRLSVPDLEAPYTCAP